MANGKAIDMANGKAISMASIWQMAKPYLWLRYGFAICHMEDPRIVTQINQVNVVIYATKQKNIMGLRMLLYDNPKECVRGFDMANGKWRMAMASIWRSHLPFAISMALPLAISMALPFAISKPFANNVHGHRRPDVENTAVMFEKAFKYVYKDEIK
jgi:hypothetical protein